jgi:hypothetical protein
MAGAVGGWYIYRRGGGDAEIAEKEQLKSVHIVTVSTSLGSNEFYGSSVSRVGGFGAHVGGNMHAWLLCRGLMAGLA